MNGADDMFVERKGRIEMGHSDESGLLHVTHNGVLIATHARRHLEEKMTTATGSRGSPRSCLHSRAPA